MKNNRQKGSCKFIEDYVRAARRQSREQEIAEHGKQVNNRPVYVDCRKRYSRKRQLRVCLED